MLPRKAEAENEAPAILGVLRFFVWIMPAFVFLMTCWAVFFLHQYFLPSGQGIYPIATVLTLCMGELVFFGYGDMRLRCHQMQTTYTDVPSQERWEYIKLFCGMQFVVAPVVGLCSICVVGIFLYFS